MGIVFIIVLLGILSELCKKKILTINCHKTLKKVLILLLVGFLFVTFGLKVYTLFGSLDVNMLPEKRKEGRSAFINIGVGLITAGLVLFGESIIKTLEFIYHEKKRE